MAKIEKLKAAELMPYANNSRMHSDEQISQIAASIEEFGFNNPILIDENNNVLAGHGRMKAAKILSIEKLPCLRLEHLSETQKKAYIIADNKLALNADWDFELLQLEVSALKEVDFDVNLLGFDDGEIKGLLKNLDVDNVDDVNEEKGVLDEDKMLLLIEFDTEQQLERYYNEFKTKGFPCKIIE